jgi:hypothetical protein
MRRAGVAEAALGGRTFAFPTTRVEVREWVIEHWDIIALTGLMVVALALRFFDLGARALHHDESLHAQFSYYMYDGRGFKHDPLMHGTFLFHINTAVYSFWRLTTRPSPGAVRDDPRHALLAQADRSSGADRGRLPVLLADPPVLQPLRPQ